MLKDLLQPTVSSKKIIIRTDQDSNIDDQISRIGSIYPLVRILDTTLDQSGIVNFNLTIGEQFLPRLSLQIEDIEYRIREKLKTNIDTLSLYIGNNKDEYFIKQEYLITSIYSNPGANTISLSCILHIPKLFQRTTRVLTGTSLDVIKTICSDVELGLSVNFQSEDQQNWIQDGCTNLTMINRIVSAAKNKFGQHLYIDQWSYLNFVDLDKAFTTKDTIKYANHPYTHDKLPEPKILKFTNNELDTEELGRILFWSPIDEYSENAINLVKSYRLQTLNWHTLELSAPSEVIANAEEIRDSADQLVLLDHNVYSEYTKYKEYSDYLTNSSFQSSFMQCKIQYLLLALYPGLNLPIEIVNGFKRDQSDNQIDSNLSLDTIPVKSGEETGKLTINQLYSGDYYLRSISYNFQQDSLMQQTLNFTQI